MAHLADLVHGATQPAFAIGEDMRVLAVNAPAEAFLGLSESVVGKPCFEVVCAVDASGASVCSSRCPVFDRLRSGSPAAPAWRWWIGRTVRRLPITVSTLAAASEEDEQHTVALVLVQLPDDEGALRVPETVDVHLLGKVEVRHDGKPVAPRRRKALELLAFLATAGPQGARRDEVLDVLWPDEPFERTGPRLRVLLHELRVLLGPAAAALSRDATSLVLGPSPDLVSDVVEFESSAQAILHQHVPRAELLAALEETLAIYRGDLAECDEFGPWVAPHREHLRRLHLDLLERAAECFAEAGDVERAIECCERALRSDPLQERFHLALIVCFGMLGRRGDALRQYVRCREVLCSELGALPSRATGDALERALRAPSVTRWV